MQSVGKRGGCAKADEAYTSVALVLMPRTAIDQLIRLLAQKIPVYMLWNQFNKTISNGPEGVLSIFEGVGSPNPFLGKTPSMIPNTNIVALSVSHNGNISGTDHYQHW